eukprot:1771841-Amphidinium_carterae.1
MAIDRVAQGRTMLVLVAVLILGQVTLACQSLAIPNLPQHPSMEAHGHEMPLGGKDAPDYSDAGMYKEAPSLSSGAGKISVVLPCAGEGDFAVKTVKSFCDHTPLQ